MSDITKKSENITIPETTPTIKSPFAGRIILRVFLSVSANEIITIAAINIPSQKFRGPLKANPQNADAKIKPNKTLNKREL